MLRQAFNWFASSFDTHSKGASARKLSAFIVNSLLVTVVLLWAIWAYRHNDWNHIEYIVSSLVFYGGTLLTMTTIQSLREKKLEMEGKKDES